MQCRFGETMRTFSELAEPEQRFPASAPLIGSDSPTKRACTASRNLFNEVCIFKWWMQWRTRLLRNEAQLVGDDSEARLEYWTTVHCIKNYDSITENEISGHRLKCRFNRKLGFSAVPKSRGSMTPNPKRCERKPPTRTAKWHGMLLFFPQFRRWRDR